MGESQPTTKILNCLAIYKLVHTNKYYDVGPILANQQQCEKRMIIETVVCTVVPSSLNSFKIINQLGKTVPEKGQLSYFSKHISILKSFLMVA